MTRTPEQDRDRLIKALDHRAKAVATATAWYDGDHPLPAPPPTSLAATDAEAKAEYLNQARLAVTNVCQMIVDVPAEKMLIEGFRFGATPTATDQIAWRIWQRNQLDADHILTNTTALKVGSAPVLVWKGADGLAEIHVEDPSQVVVAYAPGSRRRREAALKRWVDEDGMSYVTLYRPEGVYKWVSKEKVRAGTSTVWVQRTVDGDPSWPLPNPFGQQIPMVEIRANHGLKAAAYGGGVPEFQCILTDQMRLNATVLSRLITEKHQAYIQRWASDWDYPVDEDGKPDKHAMRRAGASQLWALNSDPNSDRGVQVGEFKQANFRPFIDIEAATLKLIAAKSGTAPHAFLLGDLVNVASDALARIDARQAAKVRRHFAEMSDPWEEIMRLALIAEGAEGAGDTSSSVVWADPVERTATEQSMTATTLKAVGAPQQAVFEAMPGVTQQEARRWVIEGQTEALLSDVTV